MKIQDIKQNLSIFAVMAHYNLQPNKNNLLLCPFHKDKTPSMQLYPNTNTYTCFGCGKTGDVIQFIQDFEKLDKHNAIMKAGQLTGLENMPNGSQEKSLTKPIMNNTEILKLSRTAVLTKAFNYFVQAAKSNSKQLRDYLQSRNLDFYKIEIGYNSGQFHHRQSKQLIGSYVECHLLQRSGINKNTGECYSVWAKHCIIFALKDKQNHITGLYGRSILNNDASKHFYLKDRSGLYPGYPKPETTTLILTEAVIDAATLLQVLPSLRSPALPAGCSEAEEAISILACYGTNGLTEEHKAAIKEWAASRPEPVEGKEIIFAFDGDEAGRAATIKYAEELKNLFPEVIISKLNLPDGEDLNSLSIGHDSNIFTHLIEKRIFLFSIESSNKNKKETSEKIINQKTCGEQAEPSESTNQTLETPVKSDLQLTTHDLRLNTSNPYKLRYATDTANYYIQGGISKILDIMKVTLVIEALSFSPSGEMSEGQRGMKSRNKVDLYEDKQVEKLCKDVSEKLNLRKDLLETDIYKLTDLLEEYREKEINNSKNSDHADNEKAYTLTAQEHQQLEAFRKSPVLIFKLNELLGKSGIAGEDTNRIFLLIIAISYIMPEPLHALIQGSSGSGKTRLLRQISDCIPPEKVIRLTRVSDKGFYNYPEKYLKNKLLSLEDVDGLGEEATFAFRELQSNGELNSATSVKLENGQIVSGQKRVKGPIASLACTTQGEMYEDNMSRVFLIAVDESLEQTKRIIKYQNNKAAGEIDTRKEQEIKRFIQNMVREMLPYEVVNPYANQIHLPEEAHKIRRLNELFQSFVKMLTVINQYRRSKDKNGRLLTEIEDIETGIEIMFESIVLKVDELDGSLRQFYEQLKSYVGKKGRNFEFSRFEVREATGLGKTQQHHYMNKLLELEYLQQYGFANRGFKYKIVYWDNYSAIRDKIKQHLSLQLEQLKKRISERQIIKNAKDRTPANANRTPEQQLRPVELAENQ